MGSVSKDSRAVVTGAGSGIGRAFAIELARRGGQVVCSDIKLSSAEETVRLIKKSGGHAHAIACDVGQISQVEHLALEAEQFFGEPANLIINNAGIGVGGKNIGEFSLDDWRATMDVNLWGVIHGCHVFAPRLRRLGHGGIINVASTASFAAAPLMGPYNVTKAGVLALTETLAAEFSGTDVHVTALCPTFVKTNIVRDGLIDANTSGAAARLMALTGVSPERVVRKTLNGLDRDQLYVVPQIEARAIWRGKRFAPAAYARGAGLLGRALRRMTA